MRKSVNCASSLVHAVGVAEAVTEEPGHWVGAAGLQLCALRFSNMRSLGAHRNSKGARHK